MPNIQLRTKIPGPHSESLMDRRQAAIPRGVFHYTPIFIARAKGALVEDVDGNIFIDLAGGIGCLNVGHSADPLLRNLHEQADRFLHSCFSVSPYEGYVRLAERLNELTPGTFAKKTLLVNTGAEAIENAIKIARAFTKRSAVICFEHAFHGRTLLTLSVTSKSNPYKAGFGPFVSDIYRMPFAYCYRCAYHLEYPSCKLACAHQLKEVLKYQVSAESVAAVIAEPVLGEGGFMAPPLDFFKELVEICHANGILFIADEVQTGICRTGSLFACEQYGIAPDLLASSKSLGGGLPIAAVTGRTEIMDSPGLGGLGGTYVGNPVACATALAVLQMVDEDNLSVRAQQLGDIFLKKASEWKQRWALIGAIHGLGAMRALELVRDRETREPASEETKSISQYCYERGVLILTAGTFGNVIRLLMPLVITDDQFEEALSILQDAIASVSERSKIAALKNSSHQ
jgi:4-aminobutyrate aminotransferase / (S)-3-amino-2-methylpropionate transaminase / 5-aminovalerate transaminase